MDEFSAVLSRKKDALLISGAWQKSGFSGPDSHRDEHLPCINFFAGLTVSASKIAPLQSPQPLVPL